MTDEPTPFMDYWKAVDAALLKFFGIDTSDAGIEPDLIASAQEECQTPEDFARSYGDKYGLTYMDEWMYSLGTASKTRKIAMLNDLCRKANVRSADLPQAPTTEFLKVIIFEPRMCAAGAETQLSANFAQCNCDGWDRNSER